MNQTENQPVKGYKVFNPDWTCIGFQYKVGETFEDDVTPKCCSRGFHFCTKASDCFSYYVFNPENKVAEVLALGTVDTVPYNTKCCTNKIQIVREISWQELLDIVNTGKGCTGFCNTGDRNTGDWNTGNYNTGDWNTGDWNISSFNTGCFNTKDQKILLFDKPSNMAYSDWIGSDVCRLLSRIPKNVVEWVHEENMSDEEKADNPSYETTGGYLKVLDNSECAQLWWDGLEADKKEIIESIPNFDSDIFEQCTGIKVGD